MKREGWIRYEVVLTPRNRETDNPNHKIYNEVVTFDSNTSHRDAIKFYYDNANNTDYESVQLFKAMTEYIPVNLDMTFGQALVELNKGNKVTRRGWKRPDFWIERQSPDEHSKMTKPYLYMVKNGDKFPTDLSCESILAEDWYVVE